ncbi:lipoprotein signal peptidase [Spiribacter sp. C176]|uniref:Lipoprotein signal peptidase n=1 Tax=Spiribacter salilacus TaxID=2664894 RepID=A0A6N7QQK9_9GAMM|nr:signal peptidase II [Spiribacter salilacus]MRH78711.1 lipoprotein signal peptidase [Spiribacter salilacus]
MTAQRVGLVLAVGIILADQLSKWAALFWLTPYQPVPVLPSVNLLLAFNPGAAFSLLAQGSGWQRWLLSAVAIGVSGYLVYWLWQLTPAQRWQGMAIGLVLGGAIGNLIDRLRLGVVVDFIDLYYSNWHWPAFNVADAAITIGAILILYMLIRD